MAGCVNSMNRVLPLLRSARSPLRSSSYLPSRLIPSFPVIRRSLPAHHAKTTPTASTHRHISVLPSPSPSLIPSALLPLIGNGFPRFASAWRQLSLLTWPSITPGRHEKQLSVVLNTRRFYSVNPPPKPTAQELASTSCPEVRSSFVRSGRLARRAWRSPGTPGWKLGARRRYASPPRPPRRKPNTISHNGNSSNGVGCDRCNPPQTSQQQKPNGASFSPLGARVSPMPRSKIPPKRLKPAANPESYIPTSVSKYLHLPHMPHAPTKEELLAAATGFWSRMKVRFKWVSIRSMRPWNADEWGAFVSWVMLGHLVWILVGTTTFFSIVILGINTVFAQETLAKWVGDYLTHSAGVTVVFESAIVPRWKDGVITFRNVFVSRRPGQTKSSVSKGSSSNAAAVAAAERISDQDPVQDEVVDDGNYTQFDTTINTVNVTLSFWKWWSGRGLLKDVEVKGVRGVVDRTNVTWPKGYIDPFSYRHQHNPGDFELDYFKLEDLLLTMHHPDGFRPFSVSIFSCELPQLRRQYLFYDFLSANHMSGSFDGSLFTIHPRQIHGIAAGNGRQMSDHLGEEGAWKKFSRMRVDGLKIDHLNRGVEGPFGWIYDGNVDIVADVMFPADPDEGISKIVSEFYDKLEDAVTSNKYLHQIPQILNKRREETRPVAVTGSEREEDTTTTPVFKANEPTDDRSYLIMDMRIHMNNVKAAVPLFTSDMSYINQALVRPIVAYINAKRTYIPINCRVVKRLSDFDGSWTFYDCGLMSDMSAETYEAFARDVEDQHTRVRRFKKVGFWTLSLAVHALFMGMAGNVV